MAFKEPGGSFPPLHKLAIGPYLQQDLSLPDPPLGRAQITNLGRVYVKGHWRLYEMILMIMMGNDIPGMEKPRKNLTRKTDPTRY